MKLGQYYYCHNLGIEYIEVCKVACTSIKAALLATDRQYHVGMSMNDIHQSTHWLGYTPKPRFRFTFVRNPLDRLLSCYSDFVPSGKCRGEFGMKTLGNDATLAEFVDAMVAFREPNRHYAPQTSILAKHEMGWVGHYEGLQAGWRMLQEEYPGLADLPKLNTSIRPRDWRAMFDVETLAKATAYYAADFRRWPIYAKG